MNILTITLEIDNADDEALASLVNLVYAVTEESVDNVGFLVDDDDERTDDVRVLAQADWDRKWSFPWENVR